MDVRIHYHYESEGWWADSPDLPGWTAAGDTFDEVRAMALEGAAEFAEGPTSIIEEGLPIKATTGSIALVGSGAVIDGDAAGGSGSLISAIFYGHVPHVKPVLPIGEGTIETVMEPDDARSAV
jgi:predicted RNase H-like HicB family nuclease